MSAVCTLYASIVNKAKSTPSSDPSSQMHSCFRSILTEKYDAESEVSMVEPTSVYKIILRCSRGALSSCTSDQLEPLAFIVPNALNLMRETELQVDKMYACLN